MESLKKQINDLLPIALKNGVSIKDYWDLTPVEIAQIIKANTERQKEELKIRAQLSYQTAQLTALFVSGMLDNHNREYPTVYECYPELFKDEIKEQERINDEKQKEQWKLFIQNHNNRRGDK